MIINIVSRRGRNNFSSSAGVTVDVSYDIIIYFFPLFCNDCYVFDAHRLRVLYLHLNASSDRYSAFTWPLLFDMTLHRRLFRFLLKKKKQIVDHIGQIDSSCFIFAYSSSRAKKQKSNSQLIIQCTSSWSMTIIIISISLYIDNNLWMNYEKNITFDFVICFLASCPSDPEKTNADKIGKQREQMAKTMDISITNRYLRYRTIIIINIICFSAWLFGIFAWHLTILACND